VRTLISEALDKMEYARAREFVLGAYHDLPNVLLIGSLLLGSIAGYRPLLWMAVGLLANLPLTLGAQALASATGFESLRVEHRGRCATFMDSELNLNGVSVQTSYAPSWWTTSATFFVVFTLWNAFAVLFSSNSNASTEQKTNRRAYCLSVIVISCIFVFLGLTRVFSGCETVWGALVGVLLGAIEGIAYWYILNACHSGIVPDVLQIIQNSAPASTGDLTPIVCA
jgi:hypothetical protein